MVNNWMYLYIFPARINFAILCNQVRTVLKMLYKICFPASTNTYHKVGPTKYILAILIWWSTSVNLHCSARISLQRPCFPQLWPFPSPTRTSLFFADEFDVSFWIAEPAIQKVWIFNLGNGLQEINHAAVNFLWWHADYSHEARWNDESIVHESIVFFFFFDNGSTTFYVLFPPGYVTHKFEARTSLSS